MKLATCWRPRPGRRGGMPRRRRAAPSPSVDQRRAARAELALRRASSRRPGRPCKRQADPPGAPRTSPRRGERRARRARPREPGRALRDRIDERGRAAARPRPEPRGRRRVADALRRRRLDAPARAGAHHPELARRSSSAPARAARRWRASATACRSRAPVSCCAAASSDPAPGCSPAEASVTSLRP